MATSDPIADMLTRIRNANTAKHDTVDIPASKMKQAIAKILLDEGYVSAVETVKEGNFDVIRITLKYGKDKNEKGIHFSPAGHREVESIVAATKYTLESTVKAFKEDDATLSIRIEPLSETIDKLKEIMKSQHVERLQTGECGIEGGIEPGFFDLDGFETFRGFQVGGVPGEDDVVFPVLQSGGESIGGIAVAHQ